MQKIPELLKASGLSQNAVNVFEQKSFLVKEFKYLNWDKAKAFGLLSVSIADVFGGMGSSIDQSFDGPDQEIYEKLSAKLYEARQKRFDDLLSAK